MVSTIRARSKSNSLILISSLWHILPVFQPRSLAGFKSIEVSLKEWALFHFFWVIFKTWSNLPAIFNDGNTFSSAFMEDKGSLLCQEADIIYFIKNVRWWTHRRIQPWYFASHVRSFQVSPELLAELDPMYVWSISLAKAGNRPRLSQCQVHGRHFWIRSVFTWISLSFQ